MMHKTYVEVEGKFTCDGRVIPLKVKWSDGRDFMIDQVKDVRPAASLKVGGAGIRYTIRIGERETYLFLEEMRWFVEAKY